MTAFKLPLPNEPRPPSHFKERAAGTSNKICIRHEVPLLCTSRASEDPPGMAYAQHCACRRASFQLFQGSEFTLLRYVCVAGTSELQAWIGLVPIFFCCLWGLEREKIVSPIMTVPAKGRIVGCMSTVAAIMCQGDHTWVCSSIIRRLFRSIHSSVMEMRCNASNICSEKILRGFRPSAERQFRTPGASPYALSRFSSRCYPNPNNARREKKQRIDGSRGLIKR